MGDDPCNALALTFSNRTRTRDWTYKSDDKMYHSTDYETDVKMKNLIVLFDNTSYTTKANYKGSGKGETYCNYDLPAARVCWLLRAPTPRSSGAKRTASCP